MEIAHDFNADPDRITRLVGAALNGERIHDVWPVGAAEWKCPWPTEKEANGKLTHADPSGGGNSASQ